MPKGRRRTGGKPENEATPVPPSSNRASSPPLVARDLERLGELLQSLHDFDGQVTAVEATVLQISAVLGRPAPALDADTLLQAHAALRYLRDKIDRLRTDVNDTTRAREEMQLGPWDDFAYALSQVGGSPVSDVAQIATSLRERTLDNPVSPAVPLDQNVALLESKGILLD